MIQRKKWLALSGVAGALLASSVILPYGGEHLFGWRAAHAVAAPAPAYSFPVVDSKELETMTKGQPVYLKLWATWCQPCMREMPGLQAIQEKYGSKIKVLAINIGLNETDERIKGVIAKFGLKMPVLVDKDSDITHRLGLLGTPYHQVIDKNGRVLFRGNEANAELDAVLTKLASNDGTLLPQVADAPARSAPTASIPSEPGKTTAVLFFAPWCDWYLEKQRPQDAKRCAQVQGLTNTWQKKIKDVQFVGVASGLWFDEKDLSRYQKKFKVDYPVLTDANNDLFPQHKITSFPTLVVFRDGKEIYRESRFDKPERTAAQLRSR